MNKNESTVVIAEQILKKSKQSMDIYKLFNEVAKVKEFTTEEINEKISQFHTHITIDGRFVILHDGTWALREDHPFEAVNTISTDFELFDEDEIVDETDEDDYEALEVTVVADEEDLEKEAKNIKDLIGYEEVEEL